MEKEIKQNVVNLGNGFGLVIPKNYSAEDIAQLNIKITRKKDGIKQEISHLILIFDK